MVHISIAIGRFFEALFWAILSATGIIAAEVLLAAAILMGTLWLAAKALRRR